MANKGRAYGRDFSTLVDDYKVAVADLNGPQHDLAVIDLKDLKEEFDKCKGDKDHGTQAKFYFNKIKELGL